MWHDDDDDGDEDVACMCVLCHEVKVKLKVKVKVNVCVVVRAGARAVGAPWRALGCCDLLLARSRRGPLGGRGQADTGAVHQAVVPVGQYTGQYTQQYNTAKQQIRAVQDRTPSRAVQYRHQAVRQAVVFVGVFASSWLKPLLT